MSLRSKVADADSALRRHIIDYKRLSPHMHELNCTACPTASSFIAMCTNGDHH